MAIAMQNPCEQNMETMPTNRPSAQTKHLGTTDKIANIPRPYDSILKTSLFSHTTIAHLLIHATFPCFSHDAIQVHVCFEKQPTVLSNEYQKDKRSPPSVSPSLTLFSIHYLEEKTGSQNN